MALPVEPGLLIWQGASVCSSKPSLTLVITDAAAAEAGEPLAAARGLAGTAKISGQ